MPLNEEDIKNIFTQTEVQDQRPLFNAIIWGRKTKILIDTGANNPNITEDLIPEEYKHQIQSLPKPKLCKTAGNETFIVDKGISA
jgi:hypothetical protein